MEKQLGEVLVKTYMGDITKLVVDVIVNAANSDLWMGSGVAGAIKEKDHYTRKPGSVKEITLVGLNKYVCDCFCKAVQETRE